MRKWVIVILLIITCALFAAIAFELRGDLGNGSSQEQSQSPPSSAKMTAARDEMKEWAEGRWNSYRVTWSTSSNKVRLSVIASPGANQVAVDGYCDILKDIARDFFSGYDVSGAVSVSGETTMCQ